MPTEPPTSGTTDPDPVIARATDPRWRRTRRTSVTDNRRGASLAARTLLTYRCGAAAWSPSPASRGGSPTTPGDMAVQGTRLRTPGAGARTCRAPARGYAGGPVPSSVSSSRRPRAGTVAAITRASPAATTTPPTGPTHRGVRGSVGTGAVPIAVTA